MPTYDYQCRSCGNVTEVIHSMLEAGPSVCERCGGELRRVLYPAGIIFKGSGFYRTDSRASGGGTSTSKGGGTSTDAAAKPSGEASGSSAGSGSESGGSKPAASTDAPKKGADAPSS